VRKQCQGPTIRCMEQPAGDADASAPALTVSALARRLGVAPATLRTWDRRYGVGPSGHSAGAHRRYTPADVHRLEVMRRLTLEGVSPAEAARAALAAPSLASVALEPDRTRARVVPLRSTDAAVRGLTRAALSLDARAIDKTLVEAFEKHGVLWTWDALLMPVLTSIGERWQETGNGVDVEHMMAESVLGALRSVVASAPAPRNARPVLLAGAPEELHTLPLQALAAALAERAIDARVLGARVPSQALAAAVRRGGASAVFVWAHRAELADLEQVTSIPAMRPPVRIVVGGPGWAEQPVPDAEYVTSLSEAVTVLQRAAGG
jgi:DNA-binding transcriptional MerR regulator